MPPLSGHQSSQFTKLLLIGDSGAGKTGSLASLALAGYNLRVLDTDAGLDVLANLLRPHPEALARVNYYTLTDPYRNQNGKLVPARASVWQRIAGMLTDWKVGDERFGAVSSWTSREVLVLDSLTTISNAAMAFVLAMNSRLGQKPYQSDWYDAQMMVEELLRMLFDEGIKCNVVIPAHIAYIGEENGPTHGYPNSLGKSLPPKVGRYFNSTLMVKTTGTGANVKRQIHTTTIGVVELKNTNPGKVRPSYPIETGLADYFRDVGVERPQAG